ncbi:MAG: MATE family efflux transporter [Treponema sp.]|nr:MATE family efflux transporter [Treponema sp.]
MSKPQPMTSGSPAKQLVLFTLPLLISEISHLFYSMADAIIVGQILGVNSLAAVGCTAVISSFVFGFVFGLTNGFTIALAQRFGAEDKIGVQRSFASGLLLALSFALVIMAVFIPLLHSALRLMRTPPNIFDEAYQYISIIFYGLCITAISSMFSNTLYALGNSKLPLYIHIISSLINICLDYFFILVFGWGVAGAALATILAQLVSIILFAAFIFTKYPALFSCKRNDWLLWRMPKGEIRAHLKLGIAMGLQRSIVELGNILMQAAMNGLGALAIASISAAQRIRQLNMLPLFTIGAALATYTAQNYGARKIARIYQGIRHACLISLSFSVIMGIVNFLWGDSLASLFIKDAPEALDMAQLYLKYIGATVFLLGIMLIFRNVMQGIGRSASPILCSVLETVMSVVTAFLLIPRMGFTGVCLANPLSWLASGIPLYIAFVMFVAQQRSNKLGYE